MIKKIILLSAMFIVLCPLICLADSASIGGQGNTVKILDNNEIQMVDEVIKMVVKNKEIGDEIKWNRNITEVDVIYTFKNTTDKNVSVRMGFPEKFEYNNIEIDEKLNDFLVYDENGNEIDVVFRNSEEALTRGVNWYIYDVNFAPYEEKKIQNKYWIINSSYGNYWFNYILETGASWKDKIEKIDIEVKFENGKLIYDVHRMEPSGYVFNEKNNSIEWRLSDIEPAKNDNIRVNYSNYPYVGKGFPGCDRVTADEMSRMSSSYLSENKISYYPCRATDGDEKTAWVEGVDGSGVGEWIGNLNDLCLASIKNYQKIATKIVTGKIISIKTKTMYGIIEGEIVVALNSRDVACPGVECRVKQVFIKRSLFGLDKKYHQGTSRITGSVNADFLPLISARNDFTTDSPEYKLFHSLMRTELEKTLRDIKKQKDVKNIKKITKELQQIMKQVRSALMLNPDFVPQGKRQ